MPVHASVSHYREVGLTKYVTDIGFINVGLIVLYLKRLLSNGGVDIEVDFGTVIGSCIRSSSKKYHHPSSIFM